MTNKNLQPIGPPLQPTTYHLQPSPHRLQPKAGFAMLFSVLISSLLVVIGLSIFNITLKELTISTSSRESQIAFYAANSGMECALYWDLKGGVINGVKRSAFASSTSDTQGDFAASNISAFCNGVKVNSSSQPSGGSRVTSASFSIISDANGPCTDITITKTPDSPSTGQMSTVIVSQGKNICGTSGRRVERGLQATIVTNM